MTVVVIIHLTIAAVWLGSMIYSLVVVQPRVDRFFPDLERREEFLQTLANGNRRPVVALIGGLLLTDLAILVARPEARIGYGIALPLYLLAGSLFAHVSWRHWPARVFALPQELVIFQLRLRRLAWSILALVGVAFLTTLTASLRAAT
jgi:putative copper export protein